MNRRVRQSAPSRLQHEPTFNDLQGMEAVKGTGQQGCKYQGTIAN